MARNSNRSGMGIGFMVLLISLVTTEPCPAEEVNLLAVGARFGTNEGTNKRSDLQRQEIFGQFSLPWNWRLSSNLNLDTRLNTSAGLLSGDQESSFIGTIAPVFALTDRDRKYSLEVSTGIALIPNYELGAEDFGGPIQFTLDAGLGFRVSRRIGMGYRFQHYSDAGVYGPDSRGVDYHMLELSVRFPNQ